MINAIPRLMADFDVSPRSAQWLSSIFMLTMAAVIPVTGWFLQRFTTRTAYTVAMATFLVGTVLAAARADVRGAARRPQHPGCRHRGDDAAAHDHADAGRARARARPRHGRHDARDLGGAGVRAGGVRRHPQLGSWRLVFVFVLPVAALVTALGLRQLKNVGETQAGRVSWLSVALAGARVRDARVRPERGRRPQRRPAGHDHQRRAGAGGRVRRLPAAPAEDRQPADGPARAQVADVHDHAAC